MPQRRFRRLKAPILIPHCSQPTTTSTETNANTAIAIICEDWHQTQNWYTFQQKKNYLKKKKSPDYGTNM